MKFHSQHTFIDLFAGCGGLSLGLMNAGWLGLFAIERNRDAFKTLSHNLINNTDRIHDRPCFEWPKYLETKPFEIQEFINVHNRHLKALRGGIRLVVGGPPCQGFSFAGKRLAKDPRNDLYKPHLEIVDIVQPEFVLIENVRGIKTVFGATRIKGKNNRGRPRRCYAEKIKGALIDNGYIVQQELIKASDFGVPQLRPRYFTVGIRKDLFDVDEIPNFFQILREIRIDFLNSKHLPVRRSVTVAEAISDLRTASAQLTECIDPESPSGFKEIIYNGPKSQYQELMHEGLNGHSPNSLRLVNHRPDTIIRFKVILRTCRKGVHLSDADRERLGIGKHAITPLSPDLPSHTLTTLPDDLLHYAEPRIHTVREHARLQSFPDWFEFRGKFTTGGSVRTQECPRYTQVGNAVPPLLAEAIGIAIKRLLNNEKSHSNLKEKLA